MLSKIVSASVYGINGFLVHVEVDLSPGLPNYSTVGLPDAAVRESKDRVLAAVRNSGFDFPVKKITVNLSPANIRKEGTAFDLPIAIGILAAGNLFPIKKCGNYALVGELALDGRIRPVRGILPIALAVKERGLDGLIFPAANYEEASMVDQIQLVPVSSLQETVKFFKEEWTPVISDSSQVEVKASLRDSEGPDFSDVKGQHYVKRALEVSAAGGHNVLMIGPPGSGKTMLAKRLPGILPSLTFEESLEVSKIHSVSGYRSQGNQFLRTRPFRSPHHTISNVALVGGGNFPRPGEVSLAHYGVLFLDELPEFNRNVIEVLRQPLEDGCVTVSRAASSMTFPARFMLVAAMNPCPCGYQGHPERECVCTPYQIQKYKAKISGPLLDRIDLHVEVPALRLSELTEDLPQAESSEEIRTRIHNARKVQKRRLSQASSFSNAEMTPRQIKSFCQIDNESKTLLKDAVSRLGLSARSFDRILKVSRTLADMSGKDKIETEHVAEAIGYRQFDRPVQPAFSI